MRPGRFQSTDLYLKAMITVNIIMFGVSLLLSGSEVQFTLNPFSALSPTTNALVYLGATGTIPIGKFHMWWSLISASWLHGSLIHILFNMTALMQIAPLVEREFGFHRMFIIYTLSGALGFYLSYLAGVMVTIGASASLCGLIGAALYFGKSRGGFYGQMVYKQTSGWVVGLLLIGLLVPNINNWGHGGGLAGGIALGWILGYHTRSLENTAHKLTAWALMFITAAILVWSVITGFVLRFM